MITKADLIVALTNNAASLKKASQELHVTPATLFKALKRFPDLLEIIKLERDTVAYLMWDNLREMMMEKSYKITKRAELDTNGNVITDDRGRPQVYYEEIEYFTPAAVRANLALMEMLCPELNPRVKNQETEIPKLNQKALNRSLEEYYEKTGKEIEVVIKSTEEKNSNE